MLADEGPQTWTGHVVVCGLVDEGLRVVEQLRLAGVRTVCVDDRPDERLVRALAALEVPLLSGDSRRAATLQAAGIAGAASLVCVESEDPHTLATALTARELRPDLRIVVQLRNAAVGRALEDVGIAVLDVAGLAAPSFVEACLGTGRWSLRLGDEEFAVVETVALRDGTLRELYGDLAPVGVLPASGGAPVITPGRDLAVHRGDTVVVLGEPASVDGAGLQGRKAVPDARAATPGFVGARAPRVQRGPRRRGRARAVLGGLDRGVKVATGLLIGLVVLSVGVLVAGYREPDGTRMSVLDALYFTVETVGTVGYGDFYFRDQQDWLRLWAIGLMVVGATLATVFFALLTNALVSRRLEESLGRRRITGLDEHVVVVGAGSVGIGVVEGLLASGVEVVVVEPDSDNRFLGELRRLKVPVVAADATLPDTWRELQLDRVRSVAVLTSDDMVNIETGLAVRDLLREPAGGGSSRWSHVPVVLRLFDRQLAGTVRASFDFRHVRSPAALAAPWFVGAALGLEIVDTFYVGTQLLLVARLTVARDGRLAGLAMHELAARIRVVSLRRAGGRTIRLPRRDVRFEGGDVTAMVGPYDELLALLRSDGRRVGDRRTQT